MYASLGELMTYFKTVFYLVLKNFFFRARYIFAWSVSKFISTDDKGSGISDIQPIPRTLVPDSSMWGLDKSRLSELIGWRTYVEHGTLFRRYHPPIAVFALCQSYRYYEPLSWPFAFEDFPDQKN